MRSLFVPGLARLTVLALVMTVGVGLPFVAVATASGSFPRQNFLAFLCTHDFHPLLFGLGRAGVPGLEPGPTVLETDMLTIDTIPLK